MARRFLIVAMFTVGLFGGVALAKTAGVFKDVPSGHYAEDAIAWAVETGITSGCAPDSFCPEDTVTRAQMVTMLHRFVKQNVLAPVATATSVPPAPERRTSDGALIVKPRGYAPGTPPGSYYPFSVSDEPGVDGLDVLGRITIAPERCVSVDWTPSRETWENLTYSSRLSDYLDHWVYPTGVVAYVVALDEARCSGIINPAFARWVLNVAPLSHAVARSKGSHDPREWYDSDDPLSPSKVDYPGWCQYLVEHTLNKAEYRGTMDQAEYDFIKRQFETHPTCVGKFDYRELVVP